MSQNRNKNQAAFNACKDDLVDRYAIGQFVAFDEGEIIADAETFDKLSHKLSAIDRYRPDVFVVQVAESYPDQVFILLWIRTSAHSMPVG